MGTKTVIFDCRETGLWVFALNMAGVQPTGCRLMATERNSRVSGSRDWAADTWASGGTRSLLGWVTSEKVGTWLAENERNTSK